MPDDLKLPTIPDEKDYQRLTDVVNLHKQLNEIILKERDIASDTRHINKDLRNTMLIRMAEERSHINKVIDLNKDLSHYYENEATAVEQNGANWKQLIKTTEENILAEKKRAALLRELNTFDEAAAKRKFNDQHVYSTVIFDFFKRYFRLQSQEVEHFHTATAALRERHPWMVKYKNLIGASIFILAEGVKIFGEFDKAAWDFRTAMGLTRDQTKEIWQMAINLTVALGGVGVNAKIVNNSVISLSKYMGGISNVTEHIVQTTSLLNAQLGTSIEDSSRMLRNFAVLSGTTMDAQTNMVYFTQALAGAAGVNFNDVVADFKNMREISLMMISRLPSAMAKTAVELRRMGTDLNTSAAASSKLLDFTQNIQDEMEASVLLGHSINLQKARELAYHRDIEGSTKEILRLAKLNNFAHGMDYFQMRAFSQATGRSVDDLLNMVQASEEIDNALTSSNPKIRAAAADYNKMRNANQMIANDLGKNVEYQLMIKNNQERLASISLKWHQILVKASAALLPLIDGILSVVNYIMPLLPIISAFFYKSIKFAMSFEKIAMPLGKIGLSILKIGGIIAEWAEPIGWVILALQGVYSVFTRIKGIMKDISDGNWGWAILKGIALPFTMVYDVIMKPFLEAIDSLFSLGWFAKSPSKVGLLIVKGILSVGHLIFDALVYPFVHAFSWISKIIPGLSTSIEPKVTASYVSAAQISPNEIELGGGTDPKKIKEKSDKKTNENLDILQSILEALNKLNMNMESGKIKSGDIYLDGSLVSTMMARTLEFKGSFGTNG